MDNQGKITFIKNLKERTKRAAIQVIFLTRKFDNKKELQVITYQIVKSATSVAANYRAASRAISEKALYSKMKIVEEEADETVFWIEVLQEIAPQLKLELKRLGSEYEEILKIIAKTNYTLRMKFKK